MNKRPRKAKPVRSAPPDTLQMKATFRAIRDAAQEVRETLESVSPPSQTAR